MDVDRARDFLRNNHRAVLATHRADGSSQMSPITASVDDNGYLVISSRETAMKTKNIARDNRVSVCAMNDGFFGSWLQIDGRCDIIRLPDAMDGLVEYYRSVAGEHPDWDDYRAAMEREQRVLLRISIDRAGPDISG